MFNSLQLHLHYFFRYTVQYSGVYQKVIDHLNDPDSARVITTWSGLDEGRTYVFTVVCKIKGENCPGDAATFTATTCKGRYRAHLFKYLLSKIYNC